MSFYGQMPDMYNLVLNADHSLIQKILTEATTATSESLTPVTARLKELQARRTVLDDEKRKADKDTENKEAKEKCAADLNACEDAIAAAEKERTDILAGYAEKQATISQLVDLALLQNGLLRGAALTAFVRRSVEILK